MPETGERGGGQLLIMRSCLNISKSVFFIVGGSGPCFPSRQFPNYCVNVLSRPTRCLVFFTIT